MAEKRATYCIICGHKKEGLEIGEDYVLEGIRWFKRNVTHDEKGNRLVVCKECYPEYKKRRGRYVNRQRLYVTMGVIFVVLVLIVSLNLFTVLAALIMLLLFYALSLANYTPDLKVKVKNKDSPPG